MISVKTNEQRRSSPTRPSDRIDSIDVLRGIALFGVMAINVVTEFRVSIFAQFLSGQPAASLIDRAVDRILMLAVDMKAFAVFSLLFGAGLAIQFERLSTNPLRSQLLLRRLIALLAIGLVHLCLIWNGDILTEYALAGLIALPLLFGPRWLLACAALAALGLYLAMQEWPPVGLFPDFASIQRNVAEANRIYATGDFVEVLAFRLHEIVLLVPLHVYVFPRTIGLFLIGALTWRSGILQNPRQDRLLSVAAVGIGLGFTLICLSAGGFVTARSISALANPLGTIVLALGYSAAVIAITNLRRGKMWFGWAAPLGRMAFTNYLAQSLIFGWIFYAYGLGLFGHLGAASALAIGVAVYTAQVLFSAWWLDRYRYGPMEWLWRSLMYGAAPPMLLDRRTAC